MINFFKKNKKEPETIKEVLVYLRNLDDKIEGLSRELEALKKENLFSVQKVAMARYNPFNETGGDQSFSVAFLDANNNGFIITSLYGKDTSRVYLKPIENGKSQYQLSEEEKKVLEKAIINAK